MLIETIKLVSIEPAAPSKLAQVRYTQRPVVMEYITERFIERICQDIEQAQMDCLRNHVLFKTQTKGSVQEESPVQRYGHLSRDRLNGHTEINLADVVRD